MEIIQFIYLHPNILFLRSKLIKIKKGVPRVGRLFVCMASAMFGRSPFCDGDFFVDPHFDMRVVFVR